MTPELEIPLRVPGPDRRVLLADHTKFLRVATSRLAHLSEVDVLVTDRRPPPEKARLIESAGCRLLIAG